ncbi:helix-turn-helix domain-containing protein [Mycobacteroides abscessus subsp. massiliense]|uniref:helix-turn-helix domain-containing protein n=1 Tax=Mycobacteroides abscessus TaxID=36809 RepID=UPI0009A57144|nr:helix-turn-helix domain-containing protein [Mycobacteroides abscessus]MBN7467085.1 helix-turn-helix domain-containing protein [Mycobacteroides abscessus subsp. massiliense]SLI53483.1 Helix-turn-helix domain [Mycobacteroides abscessus subsp. massiliense]
MTEMDAALSPLLTYVESGRYLRKSARFVRELVYSGELSIKRIGRTPYVHRADLDRYIASTTEIGESARRPEMTPAHKRRDVA